MRMDSTGTGCDSMASEDASAIVTGAFCGCCSAVKSVDLGVLEQADTMIAVPITRTGSLIKVLMALISKVFSPLIIRGFQEFSR